MKSSPDARRFPESKGKILKSVAVDAQPRVLPALPMGSASGGTVERGAERLLAAARLTAAALVDRARTSARAIEEEARLRGEAEAKDRGYAAGYATGHDEGLAAGREEAATLVAAAKRDARAIVSDAEQWVSQLALEVAAHLLGMELTLNPEAVERVVMSTLLEARSTEVSLAVAPADYDQATEVARQWRMSLGGETQVRIDVDPSLPRGACRVEGPNGVVERNWQRDLVALSDLFERVSRDGV